MREDLLIELENEYARMRADNERTEETRKEKIRLEQPEIFALTQEREELVFGTLRNIVKGAGKRADDLPERMEKLNEKIGSAADRQHRTGENLPASRHGRKTD